MESKNDAAVTSNATAGSGSAVPKRTYNKRKINRAFSPTLDLSYNDLTTINASDFVSLNKLVIRDSLHTVNF